MCESLMQIKQIRRQLRQKRKSSIPFGMLLYGASCLTRTGDTLINSQVL